MNKLTDDEKAKVFAMYWGAKVYGDLQDDNESANYGEVDMDFDNFNFCVSENMRLVLKPLSSISDEHKIAVAKITFPQATANNDDLAYIGYGIVRSTGILPANVHQHLIDFGYAVILYPWGKTAIELGIAIEKKTTNQQ